MKTNWQVVLAGEGGQGLVLAGVILGEAAVLAGNYVAQTAAYGIASRGGFAKSEVVISDTDIEYPAVEEADIVLVLSQCAMNKYYGKTAANCLLVYDSSKITGDYPGERIAGLPLSEAVVAYKKEQGLDMPINILSLGVLAGIAGVVELTYLIEVILGRFKRGAGLNRQALTTGFTLGQLHRHHTCC